MTLPMHGRRQHGLGGSDPVDMQLPTLVASIASVTVTALVEADWDGSVATNDRTTFAYDPADSEGLLIKRQGVYMAFASVGLTSGVYSTVQRNITVGHGLLSSGPFPGGTFGSVGFYLGPGQSDYSLHAKTATSQAKSVLNYVGMQGLPLADPTDPWRLSLALSYAGSTWEAANVSLQIVRVSTSNMGAPPLPPTP